MAEVDEHLDDVLAEEDADPEDDEAESAADVAAEDPSLEEDADPEARIGIDEPDETMLDPDAEPDDPELAATFGRIGRIGGVPLFFERGAGGQRVQTTFPVARSFVPVLEATVKQMRKRIPASYGELERISSAGLHVAKPGLHGLGRACDWDRLVFSNLEIAPIEHDHASSSAKKRRRYWAFAAICRSNSSFVLHGLFNRDHEDHVHQDNASGVGFSTASSSVKLCQALLNEMFGESLATDGDFGQRTSGAFGRATERLRLANDVNDPNVWRRFLRRSARLGFRMGA